MYLVKNMNFISVIGLLEKPVLLLSELDAIVKMTIGLV